MPLKNQTLRLAGALHTIKALSLRKTFRVPLLSMLVKMPAKAGGADRITSPAPENNNTDPPTDRYPDFPAPYRRRGHRTEIRYRQGVPERRRHETDGAKVRGR